MMSQKEQEEEECAMRNVQSADRNRDKQTENSKV